MLTISLVLRNGEHVEMEVEQVEFVRICRYRKCRIKFKTIDPDNTYCRRSHCVMESQQKHMDREHTAMLAQFVNTRVK